MPEDTGSGGVAFNLLGLPPSPAPKSGATGASAWGSLEEGGTKGVGDVMAGQVKPVSWHCFDDGQRVMGAAGVYDAFASVPQR